MLHNFIYVYLPLNLFFFIVKRLGGAGCPVYGPIKHTEKRGQSSTQHFRFVFVNDFEIHVNFPRPADGLFCVVQLHKIRGYTTKN